MTETRLVVDDKFAVVDTVLAADVASAGTFDVAYPAGFVQNDFNADLAGAGHYAQVGLNNKWTAAAGKMSASFGASLITVTNSSGETWKAGTRVIIHLDIADGNLIEILQYHVQNLADITGNVDILTDARPGMDGLIEHIEFWTTKPVTTAAKAATITPKIDGVALTGGVLALTSATVTPLGKVIAASAITGANRLYRKSKLSLTASAVTAFVEGAGCIVIRVRRTPNV